MDLLSSVEADDHVWISGLMEVDFLVVQRTQFVVIVKWISFVELLLQLAPPRRQDAADSQFISGSPPKSPPQGAYAIRCDHQKNERGAFPQQAA
jgi:hypothetical protein